MYICAEMVLTDGISAEGQEFTVDVVITRFLYSVARSHCDIDSHLFDPKFSHCST
jgi:hypothetical protein